jgi:hypothetical protein
MKKKKNNCLKIWMNYFEEKMIKSHLRFFIFIIIQMSAIDVLVLTSDLIQIK